MKNTFLVLIALLSFTCISCDDDDNNNDVVDFAYHAHIESPNTDTKILDDILNIGILFESHTGEPVHHINVRIYNKETNVEIYNAPDVAHVHETDGNYSFTDSFVMSEANGFAAHKDYVLEAKVWAHEAGLGEVVEQLEFHVHQE